MHSLMNDTTATCDLCCCGKHAGGLGRHEALRANTGRKNDGESGIVPAAGKCVLAVLELHARANWQMRRAQKPSQGGTRRNLHLRYMHEAHDTDTPERYMSDEGLVDLMRW